MNQNNHRNESSTESSVIVNEHAESEEDEESLVSDLEVERVSDENALTLPDSAGSFGDVNVDNSKFVNFGNRTIIKGQITINQILQSKSGTNINNFPKIQSSPRDNIDVNGQDDHFCINNQENINSSISDKSTRNESKPLIFLL